MLAPPLSYRGRENYAGERVCDPPSVTPPGPNPESRYPPLNTQRAEYILLNLLHSPSISKLCAFSDYALSADTLVVTLPTP